MCPAANSMFALWPGDQLNFSIFIKPTFVFADNARLRKPATSQTQTLPAMARDREELTNDMDFIDKYSTFSKGFYLTILGLAIPYYLLLYGASGHQFNPPTEDIISMTVIIISFVTLILYLRLKDKSGLGFNLMKILTTITLLVTAYGGLKVFIYIIKFDYGDDIGFFIRGLSYIIPLLFTFSTIIMLIGLFKKVE
jgi:heme/copper-type cytochrome/quinol oxidase subunit 4